VLGRFLSADTIVPSPGNPQSLNRYAYVYNNPLRFADPSGHWPGPVDRLIGRAKEAVLQSLVVAVPAGAEVMYQGYSAASSFIADHPNVQAAGVAVNDVIDAAKPAAGSVINSQDTNTMSWGDLFGTWALEQGDYSKDAPIRFGPDAALTQELMHHEGVNNARAKAMEMIAQGRAGPVKTDSWGFGPGDAFPTVLSGNALQFVLGSYDPGVTVVGNDDGSYTLQFLVKNTSGWESATRYRNGPPGQPNLGVFDDRLRGRYGLHLGGNLWEQFYWTETVQP